MSSCFLSSSSGGSFIHLSRSRLYDVECTQHVRTCIYNLYVHVDFILYTKSDISTHVHVYMINKIHVHYMYVQELMHMYMHSGNSSDQPEMRTGHLIDQATSLIRTPHSNRDTLLIRTPHSNRDALLIRTPHSNRDTLLIRTPH